MSTLSDSKRMQSNRVSQLLSDATRLADRYGLHKSR
jgi:hypothetical protein